jgi:regulatory protein
MPRRRSTSRSRRSKRSPRSNAESALDAALRALRHRDRSSGELRSRLAEQGYDGDDCEEAIATLVRTGLADDARYAEARARSLAERGAGDVRIRHELERVGIAREVVEQALGTVESETERARNVAARRGVGPTTARYLRGKGFSDEVIAGVVADVRGDELG